MLRLAWLIASVLVTTYIVIVGGGTVDGLFAGRGDHPAWAKLAAVLALQVGLAFYIFGFLTRRDAPQRGPASSSLKRVWGWHEAQLS